MLRSLLYIFCGLFFLSSISSAIGQDLVGTVSHVRDADTIEVNRVPIRLNGISAPELDTREGQSGKAFMKNLVLHKQVVCKLNGELSHDRKIGVCFLNGSDIGELTVKAGHAADCPRYSNGRYKRFETEKAANWRLPSYCRR